jgi:MFS family permease
VLVTTRAPIGATLVMAAEMLAMALLGILGGVLASRVGARTTLIVSFAQPDMT